MPTPIGHALGGVAAAWSLDRRATRLVTVACALLGAAADLDLLFRYPHRTITHSVTAVALTMIIAAAVTGKVTREGNRRLPLICGAAYATHLLLDWLGSDSSFPYGIQLFWPFSQRWFISGWDLFPPTERRRLWSIATLHVNAVAVGRELLILGPLVVALWLVRVKAAARLPAEMAGRDEAPQ